MAIALSACAPARLVGPGPVPPPVVQPPPVVVVVEPFFENATVQTRPQSETVTTWSGRGAPRDVTLVREVSEKPVLARIAALEAEHRIVVDEVRKLRPGWHVVSTGELNKQTLLGPVRLVRVIVGDGEVISSNRTLKRVATAFGVIIWPLLLVNLSPVEETQRIHGTMTLYEAEASTLAPRLLRYPTQPDFAVDTRDLPAVVQPFGLDVAYEEGLFANDARRTPVLLRGFSERLAVAVVALVEGIR